MRILSTVAILCIAGSAVVSAADQKTVDANAKKLRQNVGIGLGTLIWSNVGTGLGCQVCAATTNGTFGNQTFAVTTGTSGAEKWDNVVQVKSLNDYVASNLDAVARDMAAGEGESISAMADILGLEGAERARFAAALQARFGEILPEAGTDAAAVSERILAVAAV